jgi:Ca2+-binding RTX toxin-like protein
MLAPLLRSRNGKSEPLYGIAATTQSTLSSGALKISAILNPAGQLAKAVDLEPFDKGGADVIFGGLDNDSLHGGAGQDAISGAEALPAVYASPGPSDLTFTGEKFDALNYATPLNKIANHPLNFDATEADGADKLFGDIGNDWLVGGAGRDNLYGGFGNDILNTDDNLETSGVDAAPGNGPDIAFGGGGRDILLANATTDRLIDWVGEYNNYYVPFNPFGQNTMCDRLARICRSSYTHWAKATAPIKRAWGRASARRHATANRTASWHWCSAATRSGKIRTARLSARSRSSLRTLTS